MEMIKATNFLTNPPYEPGDKPCFDRGTFGATLFATWERGSVANSSATVTGPSKGHDELIAAAEKPLPPPEKFVARPYYQRWASVRSSYGDIRRQGKIKRKIDVTYGQAAQLEQEAFLHRAIDVAAPERRRQIRRHRVTRLWQQERCRRQPRRILYFLKQPRNWLEARILMVLLEWLTRPKPTTDYAPDRKTRFKLTGGAVNCVSDSAAERSRKNDQRMPKRRRYVLPGPSEELDLARRAKNGDAVARDWLLSAHWPLVHQIAKKHATEAHPLFDLIQEGFVGLTRSFDKFDPEAGSRFSTFALRPVEWAILDYKRREQKKDLVPLDGAMVENVADLGNFNDATARTSTRPAMVRLAATMHISPYQGGLAPETRDFIDELNAEAAEDGIDVKYVGLANRIEARGDINDIKRAAAADNLGGWFLRGGRKVGYFQGEHGVLKAGNAQWRKRLRKLAKRKQA